MTDKPVKRGAYGIFNTRTGRVYIGCSAQMAARWRDHVSALTYGRHHCPELQADWRFYGAEAFEFRVLEDASIVPLRLWPPDGLEARWYAQYAALAYWTVPEVGRGGTRARAGRHCIRDWPTESGTFAQLREERTANRDYQRQRLRDLMDAGLTASQASALIAAALRSLRLKH